MAMATRRSLTVRKVHPGFAVLSVSKGKLGSVSGLVSTDALVSEEAAKTWAWENLSVPMFKWTRQPDGSLLFVG
jgi:hypothetical protein